MKAKFKAGVPSSANSARFKVESHSDISCPWMFTHKSRCADVARFLAIGEQHDYVIHKGASRAQCANAFENGGRAGAIIRRAWSSFNAIVMGHKQNRWSGTVAALQSG